MLYLSGDNNLSSEMVRALKDIQDEDPPCGIKMTTLYDALSPCCPTYVTTSVERARRGLHGAEPIAPNLLKQLKQRTEGQGTEPKVIPELMARYIVEDYIGYYASTCRQTCP